MKRIVPIGIRVLALVGCGQFGKSNTASTDQVTPSPSPQTKVKVADFPTLFGKSVTDIKKQINEKVDYESSDVVHFKIPQGYLEFDTRASVGKEMTFRLADNASGNNLELYAKTPQELADFVGIDLNGKTPTANNDTYFGYEDIFNGKPVEITFSKDKTSSGKEKFVHLSVTSKGK